jgi:hypothetical protein
MLTRTRPFLCALALFSCGAPTLLLARQASKPADASIALRLSTLGVGLEAGKLLNSHLSARVGGNVGSWSGSSNKSDISYDAHIKLKAVSALLDLYPHGRGTFHLTGGFMTNPLTATGTGRPTSSGTFTINNHTYTAAQVGTLTATGKWPGLGPYFGLGFGTAAKKGGALKLLFDIGMVIGKPKLALSATGSAGAQFTADLEAQRAKTEKDIDKIAIGYPVISLGLGYHF